MAENKREPRKAIKHWMRSEVFIKDNFTCLICGVKPCIMPKNYDGKKNSLCWRNIFGNGPYCPLLKGR